MALLVALAKNGKEHNYAKKSSCCQRSEVAFTQGIHAFFFFFFVLFCFVLGEGGKHWIFVVPNVFPNMFPIAPHFIPYPFS
jgi:hypothetical protein